MRTISGADGRCCPFATVNLARSGALAPYPTPQSLFWMVKTAVFEGSKKALEGDRGTVSPTYDPDERLAAGPAGRPRRRNPMHPDAWLLIGAVAAALALWLLLRNDRPR
jgi:hypothetical protein